jgi:hypothetical protein
MSAQLLQRGLDISATVTTSTASEEESFPTQNPFGLLDDQAPVFYSCLAFLSFDILENITQSYLPMLSIAHLTTEHPFLVNRADLGWWNIQLNDEIFLKFEVCVGGWL